MNPVIYEPKGAAREYAPLACNLYTGCSHGCLYCYAPGCRHMTREQFTSDVRPYPDILERLEKDADKMVAAGDRRRVLFSFTSDPYQVFEPGCDVTRQALQIMVDRGLNFEVCTKGGLRAERDFDLLKQGGRFGQSIAWWNTRKADECEPHADNLSSRFFAGQGARENGIYNWVSVEPVIDPSEVFSLFFGAKAPGGCWVDEIRVGKINPRTIGQLPPEWQERVRAVDWQAFTDEAYDLLLRAGKPFMFKESLHPYLNGKPAKVGYEVTP